MATPTSFLGTGWGFPPTFSKASKSVGMVSDEDDICESLVILLHTSLGERVLQPNYGASLKDHVFEPMNATTVAFIQDLITTAIVYHEPRIQADKITVTPEQAAGRLLIGVQYTIRATNTRFNFVFPFYLEEGGDINVIAGAVGT